MKPFVFTMAPQKIRGALIFAGKNDIRAYLNGLSFESWRDGVICVATDGHRIVVVYHGNAFSGLTKPAKEFRFTLDRTDLERALKCEQKPVRGVALDYVFKVHEGEGGHKGVVINAHGTQLAECQSIEDKYLDWQRVIPRGAPDTNPANLQGYNAEYLADYLKLAKALEPGARFRGVTFQPNGSSAMRVCIGNPDVISCVMPMRTDGMLEPAWFFAPHRAPDEEQAA